jgi:hypothetical protein
MPEDRIDHPALREKPVSPSATAAAVPSTAPLGGVLAGASVPSDRPLSLSRLADFVPSASGRGSISPSTLWRWGSRGVKRPDGTRVRLRTWRHGGRVVSSREALDEFMTALQEPSAATPAPRAPSERRRAAERASRKLQEAGW